MVEANPRNLDGVLEREEEPLARPLFGWQLQQVAALEGHAAAGNLVPGASGQHEGQRALAGAVRPHDGVRLTLSYAEVDPLENLDSGNLGV